MRLIKDAEDMSVAGLKGNRQYLNAKNRPDTAFFAVRFMHVFKRRWWIILIICLLSVAAGELYWRCSEPVYTRGIKVLVNQDKLAETMGPVEVTMTGNILSNRVNLDNEVAQLKSSTIVRKIIEDLDIAGQYYKLNALGREQLFDNCPFTVITSPHLANDVFTVSLDVDKERIRVATSFWKNDLSFSYEHISDTISIYDGNIRIFANRRIDDGLYSYEHLPIEERTQQLTSALHVAKPTDKSGIITMTLNAGNRIFADNVLLRLVDVYNEACFNRQKQHLTSSIEFLHDRLGIIEDELIEIDRNIAVYQRSHPYIMGLQEVAGSLALNSLEKDDEIAGAIEKADRLKNLYAKINDCPVGCIMPQADPDYSERLTIMIDEYNLMAERRQELIELSSETSPLAEDLYKKLRTRREAILETVNHILTSQIQHLDIASHTLLQVENRLEEMPDNSAFLTHLGRMQRVKVAIYEYLLRQREEKTLLRTVIDDQLIIIEPPYEAGMASLSHIGLLSLAFFIGIIIAMMLLLCDTLVFSKLIKREEIEAKGISVAAEIPSMKRSCRRIPLVIENGNRDRISESFRVLRSHFLHKHNHSFVLMVTSLSAGSGKSFVASNLSLAFGLCGKKVLLIDGDLRHPTTSQHIGNDTKGLSYLLSNRIVEAKEAVAYCHSFRNNVDILPVGSCDELHPGDLFADNTAKNLISGYKKFYDVVIIDAPPVEVVSDSQELVGCADRIAIIVRAGHFKLKALGKLETIVADKNYPQISVVLNDSADYGEEYGYYGNAPSQVKINRYVRRTIKH